MAKYKIPTIQDLIDSGAHFGHNVRRWHPKMEKYIYTVNKNVHIIDLEETEKLLKNACDFLYETAKNGKPVVFVGTKRQSREIVEAEARRCGAMYVTERWIGGTITNFKMIKKNLDKLIDYIKGKKEGAFDKYTKKERLLLERESEKNMLVYGGIINMKGTPGALFIIDPKREKTAIREAMRSGVKTVALIDTNSDPTDLDYPIPGNDDALKPLALIVKTISSAVEEGYKEWDKIKKENNTVNDEIKEDENIKNSSDLIPEENIEKIEKEVEKVVVENKEKSVEKPILKGENKDTKKKSRSKKEDKK
ncbi:MAG TPA: 30S ribosomal protein S2 [bacterium]|nr:30S ribosomal protein S2 [bacterium]